MTSITLSSESPSTLKVDAVVIGVAAAPAPAPGTRKARKSGPEPELVLTEAARNVDKAMRGKLAAALRYFGATGKAEEVTKVAGQGTKAPVVLAVGLGPAPAEDAQRYEPEALRRAAGAAARALAGSTAVGLALPDEDAESVAAVAEGALLGAYGYLRYRSGANGAKAPVAGFTLITGRRRDRQVKAAVARAEVVAGAVNLARDLVNTPPADLRPAAFAAAADTAGRDAGLQVEVMDEAALRAGGYGGILAVGQGSDSPPRLVRLSWRHRKAKRHIALVGKGITFDSGGLSLKPPDGMITMKCDMGGAAAVIAAAAAIARLNLPVNVTAWAPMAENMPSGTAQRPSDVLRIYGGKTVEVLNTDAEGRLVLADALVRACEDEPDLLVDAATLTGAAVVALGNRTSAIMSNDDELREQVHQASARAGEGMWPMPLPEELRKTLDSSVADIANVGDRWGGALSAGVFLREFVAADTRWAHLDIAGPAFNSSEPYGYTPKGGTGAAVRTLVRLAEDVAERG